MCPLCGKPMSGAERTRRFPPFLKATHSLSVLSDAVVHQDCFDAWEHKATFVRLLDRFKELMSQRPDSMDWKEGEMWSKAQGERFNQEAAVLDPSAKTR